VSSNMREKPTVINRFLNIKDRSVQKNKCLIE